ncbi:histone-lysine N-methyltransferase SETMAR-like [Tachypleus tridentatus]|uniref:histone-lysine N-methyltransferase SETMAR-like n=1 Tax=Tachypleus tridentatus TaxID=6853 RepID=UPI003FCF663E
MDENNFCLIFPYDIKLVRKTTKITWNVKQAFGHGSLTECTVQRWFQKFRHGNESLEDHEDRGRKPFLDEHTLRKADETAPPTKVRELTEKLGTSKSSIANYLSAIGKTKCWISGFPMS